MAQRSRTYLVGVTKTAVVYRFKRALLSFSISTELIDIFCRKPGGKPVVSEIAMTFKVSISSISEQSEWANRLQSMNHKGLDALHFKVIWLRANIVPKSHSAHMRG